MSFTKVLPHSILLRFSFENLRSAFEAPSKRHRSRNEWSLDLITVNQQLGVIPSKPIFGAYYEAILRAEDSCFPIANRR